MINQPITASEVIKRQEQQYRELGEIGLRLKEIDLRIRKTHRAIFDEFIRSILEVIKEQAK